MKQTPRLVMIADDLTGSFDTGAGFEIRGASVGFASLSDLEGYAAGTDVVVIDTESRHDAPPDAYEKTARAARWAKGQGVQQLYIKTDSGLRGNIGPSLKAALDVTGCPVAAFAPAFPDMKRTTAGGCQLVDGVPVHQSVFGRDPFDPVTAKTVRELILPHGLAVRELTPSGSWEGGMEGPAAWVFDAATNGDLSRIAGRLQQQGLLGVTAGCSAFAAALYPCLGLPDTQRAAPPLQQPLFVVCGSVNPITRAQLLFGEGLGYARRVISPSQLTSDSFWHGEQGAAWRGMLRQLLKRRETLLIDTGLEPRPEFVPLREAIAARLGWLVRELILLPECQGCTPMVIGGDTLMGFLSLLKQPEIRLEGEAARGVVIFSALMGGRRVRMLSKSGGFGEKTLLKDICDSMTR